MTASELKETLAYRETYQPHPATSDFPVCKLHAHRCSEQRAERYGYHQTLANRGTKGGGLYQREGTTRSSGRETCRREVGARGCYEPASFACSCTNYVRLD